MKGCDLSLDDEQQRNKLLEDRMKCIATEIEIEKEEQRTKTKAKREPDTRFPISDKEPTREHVLLRDAAAKWEKEMHAKYMKGQVMEILDGIIENVDGREFPPRGVLLYHKWTQDIMDEANTGYTLNKYPQQNLEQIYCHARRNGSCWAVSQTCPRKERNGRNLLY